MNAPAHLPAKPGNKLSGISSLFIWLGGASPEAASSLSPSQRRILVGTGIAVLVPMTLGFASAAYTVSLMTTMVPLVLFGGLVWAAMMAALDQLVLSAMSRSAGRRALQGVMRVALALVLGIAISHPLTLRVFHDRLSTQIEQQRRDEVSGLEVGAREEIKQLQLSADREPAKIGEVQAPSAVEASPALKQESSSDPFRGLREGIAAEQANNARLWDDLRHQEEALAAAKAKWQDEIDGKLGGRLAVRGKEADRIEKEEVRPLDDRVRLALAAIDASDKRTTALRSQLAEQERADATQNAAVRIKAAEIALAAQEQTQRLHEQAVAVSMDEARALNTRKIQVQQRYDAEIARVRAESRNDVLTRTEALHALADAHPFVWIQYGIMLLAFLAWDTLPIFVKLFSDRNHYDRHMEREDWAVQEDMKAFQLAYPHFAVVKLEVEMRCAAAAAELSGFGQRFQQQLDTIKALSSELETSNRRLMAMLAQGYEASSTIELDHVRQASDQTLLRLKDASVTALHSLSAQLGQAMKLQA